MHPRSGMVGVWLVVLLCQGCATQTQEQQQLAQRSPPALKGKEQQAITKETLEIARIYVNARKALATKPVPCNPTANVCERVKIEIIQIPDSDGNVYCVGLIPEKVQFGPPDNARKTIVWEIVLPANPDPSNSTFEFYDETTPGIVDKVPGIVVLSDSTPRQLKGSKIGNGNAGNKDRHFWNMTNDHTDKLDASYLPFIVQTVPAPTGSTEPAKVSVCGTPDPRMTND